MVWVKNASGFRDFLSLVIVHAPDSFPEEDYLEPEQQLNLEMAFRELQSGLGFLPSARINPSEKQELEKLLRQAHRKYLEGQDVQAAHLLQKLEAIAFPGK
jgi:hypothetical protein